MTEVNAQHVAAFKLACANSERGFSLAFFCASPQGVQGVVAHKLHMEVRHELSRTLFVEVDHISTKNPLWCWYSVEFLQPVLRRPICWPSRAHTEIGRAHV